MRTILMRFSFFTAALILAAACVTLHPAARAGSEPPALTWMGGVAIPPDGHIGGLSGLRVEPDGSAFTAVADDGGVVTGRLVHDEAGGLTGVDGLSLRPLGGVPHGDKRAADAESLSRLPDGGWLVGFEQDHRILLYSADQGLTGQPRRLKLPAAVGRLPRNAGLESIVTFPDGTILTIAEGRDGDGLHPAWIGREGTWRAFRYKTDPAFSPTDADLLPNGDVLVVERHFSLLRGVLGQLVLIEAEALETAAAAKKGVVEGTLLGAVAPPIGVDNFEGLSVRTAPDGTVLAYIVSDDNFSAIQRTLLVQYAVRIAGRRLAQGR